MNWHEIDLTTSEGLRALDQVIAERHGWTEFRTETHWFEEPLVGSYEREMLLAAHPVFSEYREVPAYSTSADAAMSLIENMPQGSVTLQYRVGLDWRAAIDIPGRHISDAATTAPLAICVVWLDWFDGLLKIKEASDGST